MLVSAQSQFGEECRARAITHAMYGMCLLWLVLCRGSTKQWLLFPLVVSVNCWIETGVAGVCVDDGSVSCAAFTGVLCGTTCIDRFDNWIGPFR